MSLIDADVLLDKTIRKNSVWKGITNSEGKNLEEIVSELPSVNPQEPKTEQWQELKETIIELRDNNGMCTQQEVCKFLANLMNVLEKQMQEPKTGHWIAVVDKWGDIVTTVNGYRCDKCNTFNADKDNYCPNCGARMEGE